MSSFSGFSTNEIFYLSATSNGTMPSDVSCNTYFMDPKISAKIDTLCNGNFTSLSTEEAENCVKRQLCRNKSLGLISAADQMDNLQTRQRLLDITDVYNENIINTINLGIGILAMSYYIFTNKAIIGL